MTDLNDWLEINKRMRTKRKKIKKSDFNPDQKYLDKSIDEYIKSGGKIKIAASE